MEQLAARGVWVKAEPWTPGAGAGAVGVAGPEGQGWAR